MKDGAMQNSLWQRPGIEAQIITFVHILRGVGITVGISEEMEALKVLSVLDVTDKDQVYRGLSAILAKSRRDVKTFDEAFHAFFVPPQERAAQMARFYLQHNRVEQLKEDFVFKEQTLDMSAEDIETYASMPEDERQKIRDFLHKAETGVNMTEGHKGMIEQQVHSILRRQRDVLGTPDPLPNRFTGVDEWDAILYDLAQQRLSQDLLLKDIADIDDDEMKEAVVLIRRLARQLANRIGRRYKSSTAHHTVDVRRSIRSGLRYGGVLMDLKYKKHRIQRPTVIVITDISGSMLKYSGFLLELMYGLSTVLPNIRSFVFAEHLKRVDLRKFDIDTFAQDSDVGDGTDFYTSLLEFKAECDRILTKNTILIILSDGKTIHYREAAEDLAAIGKRIKDILWLNPLHKREWERFSMTKAFLPHVSMVEASSIESLTKALKNI